MANKKKKIGMVAFQEDEILLFAYGDRFKHEGHEVITGYNDDDLRKIIPQVDGLFIYSIGDTFVNPLAEAAVSLPPTLYLHSSPLRIPLIPNVKYLSVYATRKPNTDADKVMLQLMSGELESTLVDLTIALAVFPGHPRDYIGYSERIYRDENCNLIILSSVAALMGIATLVDGIAIISDGEHFVDELRYLAESQELPPIVYLSSNEPEEPNRVEEIHYEPLLGKSERDWLAVLRMKMLQERVDAAAIA